MFDRSSSKVEEYLHRWLAMGSSRNVERTALPIIRVFFEEYDEPIMIVSSRGELLYVNSSGRRFLKFSFGSEELPEELREFFKARLESLLELPPDHPKRDELIMPVGNRIFLVRLTVVNLRKGAPSLLIALRDMTLLRKVQEDALKILDKVTEIFMEPLTTIKGFVETLLDGAYADPQVTKEFLKVIEGETNKMIRTLVEVKSRLTLHVKEPKLNLEEIDLRDLVEELMRTFLERALEKGISISWELQPNLPKLVADREKLKVVLYNVLDNALKFTDLKRHYEPSHEPEVHLDVQFHRDTFTFIVRDNGVGIPEDELPRIGERFFKASNAKDTYGVGLGLAVVKDLIRLHKGHLEIRSELGRGTEVIIKLPYNITYREGGDR